MAVVAVGVNMGRGAGMVEGAEASNHNHYPQREGSWSKGSGELGKKKDDLINAGEGVEKREPSYSLGGNAN